MSRTAHVQDVLPGSVRATLAPMAWEHICWIYPLHSPFPNAVPPAGAPGERMECPSFFPSFANAAGPRCRCWKDTDLEVLGGGEEWLHSPLRPCWFAHISTTANTAYPLATSPLDFGLQRLTSSPPMPILQLGHLFMRAQHLHHTHLRNSQVSNRCWHVTLILVLFPPRIGFRGKLPKTPMFHV